MTTVRVKAASTDPRPKKPRVDRGQEHEALVRQLFALSVDEWFAEAKRQDPKGTVPDKEVKGDVVDNLTALFCSAIETTVDAATDTYLSTFDGADDADDDSDLECPECQAGLALEEDAEDGDSVQCSECNEKFEISALECGACKTEFFAAEGAKDTTCPRCGKA